MLVKTSRWLKKPMFSALFILFLFIGGYASLYRISDYSTLNRQANTALANSHRQVTFDNNIGRRVFPRPTIILKNVILTEQDGKTPAIHVEELRVGIAWSSLWNERAIEKLVAENLSGSLKRDNNGEWNISDIWQAKHEKKSLKINRLIINNSQINLHLADETLQLNNIYFTSERSGKQFDYTLNAQVTHPQWDELNLRATGQAQLNPQQFILPNASIQFRGKENGYDFSGSLKTQATWQPKHFEAKQSQLEFNSKRFDTHINISMERTESQQGSTKLTGINSTYSLRYGQQDYTGSLNAPQAAWMYNILSSDDVNVNLSTQTSEQDKLNITLHGSGTWQASEGARLNKVKMNSLQTTASNQTRFASEWEGNVHMKNYQTWDIQAQGIFDRQPAVLAIIRTNNDVRGSLSLSKLDLSNYIDTAQLNEISYPNFPENQLQFQIGVSLGTLKLPNLEINNIHTQIHANAQKIEFNPLSAELYGGQSSGNLSIANTLPLSFELQQNSQNVQIQPLIQDLFKISRISGQGQAQFNFKTQGQNRKELIANLSGSLKLNVQNGQWLGINFAQLSKSALGSEDGYSDLTAQAHTPFSHFTLESNIQQGISQHTLNAQLTQPVALLSSEGETDFNTGNLRDDVIIQTTSAPDLPIRLSGKLDSPNVSLNYQKLTSASQTPEERQKAISETLKQQWQWLKQEQQ